MRHIPFFLLLLSLVFICSCDDGLDAPDELVIATFNVQTLFDDVEDGDELAGWHDYDGWNSRRYEARLARLREALKGPLDADIVLLQEVESPKVLEDLLDEGLRRRGWRWYAHSGDSSPIGTALISKIPPGAVTVHSAGVGRLVLSAEFSFNGRLLTVFCLHAKSNVGDEEDNIQERKDLARLLNSLTSAMAASPIIIAGDFNTEVSSTPDDMLCLAAPGQGAGVAFHGSIPVSHNPLGLDRLTYYDLLLDGSLVKGADGTYFYNGRFHDYDRVLMNRAALESWTPVSLEVVGSGWPEAYDNEEWSGFSDHFAVKLTLR